MASQETKIYVTGGTGLLGTHLLPALVAKGYTVRATYRTSHPDIPGVEWVETDILDVIALEDTIAGMEVVFHCAALVSYDPTRKRELHQLNVTGTANVVNAAVYAGVRQLIYVSSVAALGSQDLQLTNEEAVWKEEEDHNDYACSKHAAEMEIRRGEIEGLDVTIVNPSIILGNGDWDKGSTEIFKKIYHGFPYYTKGVHGFVDVLDVVDVLLQLIGNPHTSGERYILNGANLSYKELFDLIAHAFKKNEPQKEVTPLQAGLIWRLSYLRSKLTGKPSMLTRHSARIAQADIRYDNTKILEALPGFQFRPIQTTVSRICGELEQKYPLV